MKYFLRFRPVLGVFAALLTTTLSLAQTFSVNLTASRLYDSQGIKLGTDALVLLVADTGNDGFQSFLEGSELSLGQYLNSDDQILGLTAILGNGTGTAMGGFDEIAIADGLFPSLNVGDSLAVAWFSTLTGLSTSLVAGETYGLFGDTIGADGSYPWLVPAGSTTLDLIFKTQVSGGSYAESTAHASYTVSAIPEPSTYAALLGLAALGFTAYRRRQRK